MNVKTHLIAASLLFCLSAVCFVGHAQETDGSGANTVPVGELRVFSLKHADVRQAFDIISTMLDGRPGVRLTVDSRANSIVAGGTKDDLNRIADLLKVIDVNAAASRVSHVLRIPHGSAVEVARITQDLFSVDQSSSVRVAVDENNNTLILSGDPKEIEAVQDLVKKLLADASSQHAEAQAGNCNVRVTWLVDSSGMASADFLSSPHPSLGELVTALNSDGSLQSAKTLTVNQTAVQVGGTLSNGEFNNTSVRVLADDNGNHRGEITMMAKGYVKQVSDDKFALEISLELAKDHSNLSIGTTLTLPKNHPVAFSMTDVGDFKSVAVVEVLTKD